MTNGFTHIEELTKRGIETYLLGGKVKVKTGAVIGSTALFSLKNYNFDVVFIGANGINFDGYSTPDPEEVLIKSEAVKRGRKVFFLCDHSKFNERSFINFASLKDGILITDSEIPKDIKEKMEE